MDVKHAFGVADGTNALILGLQAIGIKENDEVVKMIIEKWLNNTTISKNNQVIYWNLDISKFENKSWFIKKAFANAKALSIS